MLRLALSRMARAARGNIERQQIRSEHSEDEIPQLQSEHVVQIVYGLPAEEKLGILWALRLQSDQLQYIELSRCRSLSAKNVRPESESKSPNDVGFEIDR
jgi:hypothetical protein